MGDTSIEWTEKTWNPTRGCSRISPGCGGGTPGPNKGGCYAEAIAERFSGPGQPFEGFAERGKGWTRKVALVPEKLSEPLHWKKPARIFVNSMSDLFHEELSNEDIAAVFGVMAAAPQHTFQVLTKRAVRMREWFEWIAGHGALVPGGDGEIRTCLGLAHARGFSWSHHIEYTRWPLPSVWLGVSAEDQPRADERVPLLLDTPAAVRFVSAEPLLGPVNFCAVPDNKTRPAEYSARYSPLGDLDWIIIGSESGHGARPMDPAWARRIVDDCKEARVAVFTKQIATDAGRLRGDRKGGNPRFWPSGDWPREFPEKEIKIG